MTLREAINESGHSINYIACCVDVSRHTLYRVMAGKMPSMDTAQKLRNLFDYEFVYPQKTK